MRATSCVLGGAVLFAALIERGGLLLAVFACVLTSSLAAPLTAWRRRILTAAGTAIALAWLLAGVLDLPIPIVPRP